MNIRLVISDLDDSLLNQHSELSPRSIEAFHRVQEAGAMVALASGRMAHAMIGYARQLGVTLPLITFNGADIVDPTTMRSIISHKVPRDLAREVARYAEEIGLHVQTYRDDKILVAQSNPFAERYKATMRAKEISLHPVGMPLSEYISEDVSKLLCIDTPERISELLPVFQARYEGRLSCSISRPHYMELTPPEASKGQALTDLCAYLNIPLEQVAAFGDGLNDLPMLTIAGFGCTVANAREAVRQAVQHVAPSNREDGVAQMLESLLAQGVFGKGA